MKEPASPPLSAGLRFGLEFMKAGHRLMGQRGQYGGPAPCALVWAVRFAQEKLAALAVGGLADRLEEARRFSFDAGIGEALLQGDIRGRLFLNISVELDISARTSPLNVLVDLQCAVRKQLDAYLSGQEVTLAPLQVSYEVTRTNDNPDSGRVLLHLQSMKDAVLLHLFHLLAELGPRLKKCGYCGQLFLAGRMDKKFCSGTCQAMQYKRDHPKKKHRVSRRTKGRRNHGT